MHTETRVKTASGDLYLKKLCRHFAHKVPASLESNRGMIEFPFGLCRLEATADCLQMAIHLQEASQADKAERVLAEHLARMASKETLDIRWIRSST